MTRDNTNCNEFGYFAYPPQMFTYKWWNEQVEYIKHNQRDILLVKSRAVDSLRVYVTPVTGKKTITSLITVGRGCLRNPTHLIATTEVLLYELPINPSSLIYKIDLERERLCS